MNSGIVDIRPGYPSVLIADGTQAMYIRPHTGDVFWSLRPGSLPGEGMPLVAPFIHVQPPSRVWLRCDDQTVAVARVVIEVEV